MTLAERALRGILATSPTTRGGRLRLKVAIDARRLLVRLRDPVIRHPVAGVELELPLSHELPFYLHDHPRYGRNAGELAVLTGGPVVDIGANVGDTAAIVRAYTDAPILCIEGEDRFFELLRRNAALLEPPPELEHAFVAAGTLRGRVVAAAGTARVVAGEGDVPARPLGEILADHPAFARPRLLKLDTDGMDVPILLAELELLGSLRPVLLFEYDPHLGAGTGVFDSLRTIGYERAYVWENTGEPAGALRLDDTAAVGDVHRRYRGHGGSRYADIAAFHADDGPLAQRLEQAE
jgi:FkbM family methyltransferase